MTPNISVIIPSYNSARTLGLVLDAALNQPQDLLKEVIVVDSSDNRATPDLLASRPHPKLRVIRIEHRTIPALARNIGAEAASGTFLAFVDSDAAPSADWLRCIDTARERGTRIGGGAVCLPKAQASSALAAAQYFLQFNEFVDAGGARQVKFTPSCNLFCERKLFFETGGFPGIRAAEDVVFCLKASRLAPFMFHPEVKVDHYFRESVRGFMSNQFLLGKYVLVYRRAYYGSWFYQGLLPLLIVLPVLAVKLIRIPARILRASSTLAGSDLRRLWNSLPWFLLGLWMWGAGFVSGCAAAANPEWSALRRARSAAAARQKILFLTNLLPFPLDNGGKIRTHRTLTTLGYFCDIDLVCFVEDEADLRHLPGLADVTTNVECIIKSIRYRKDRLRFFCEFLKSIVTFRPYVISKYASDKMQKLVRRKLIEQDYDKVYVDHLQLLQFVPHDVRRRSSDRIVLDTHNVESDLVHGMAQTVRNPLVRAGLQYEQIKLAAYERRACLKSGLVFAITEENRQRFMDLTENHTNCRVAPFVIDPLPLDRSGSESRETLTAPRRTILFMGTMSWFPNEDGLLWFYHEIFVKYGMAAEGWTLLVVGDSPSAKVLNLRKDPAVDVTGYVQDVAPYIKRASVGIVPMRIRAGLRIKLLEFMSRGLPVITTSVGCEGISCVDDKHLLIADTAEAWRRALTRCDEDAGLALRLRENGYALLREQYSQPAATQVYQQLLTVDASVMAAAGLPEGGRRLMRVHGVHYDNDTVPEMLDRMSALASAAHKSVVSFLNIDCLRIASIDPGYRNLLSGSNLVLPDGVGMKIATRLSGGEMRGNCNGSDLIPLFLERAAALGLRVYLLGSAAGVAATAASRWKKRIPGLVICGWADGFLMTDDAMVDAVNAANADLLLVGLGTPLQEKWIGAHRERLNARMCIGVGALFDWISGRKWRAPLWIRRLQLEWAWRILIDFRRMFKRYILQDLPFLASLAACRFIRRSADR